MNELSDVKIEALFESLFPGYDPKPRPILHLKPLAKEIQNLLKVRLIEVIPNNGSVNQEEDFKAKFRLSVSNANTGKTFQFLKVKVRFRPGLYAYPKGTTLFEFDQVNSLYPQEITVDFKARPPDQAPPISEEGPEQFVRVFWSGVFNPTSINAVSDSTIFHTEILET